MMIISTMLWGLDGDDNAMEFWMVIISTIPWGLDGDNKHHAVGFGW
jgi:hypothetical protein